MAHTNETTNYDLPIFTGTDKPSWLNDFNGAMTDIDTQMKANADAASAAYTKAEGADGAVTTLSGRVTTAEGDIDTLEGKVSTLEGDIPDLELAIDHAEYLGIDGPVDSFSFWGAAGFLSGDKKKAYFDIYLPKAKKTGVSYIAQLQTLTILIAASDGHIDGNNAKNYKNEPVALSCQLVTENQVRITIEKPEAFNATYGNCPIYAHGTIAIDVYKA